MEEQKKIWKVFEKLHKYFGVSEQALGHGIQLKGNCLNCLMEIYLFIKVARWWAKVINILFWGYYSFTWN